MTWLKDPAAVLDYRWDWGDWLADGDSIVSHVVDVPPGITLDSHTATGSTVTAWLSGGTATVRYEITCHIVTADGRSDDRTARIYCTER